MNIKIFFNNLQWALAEEREEIDAAIRRVLDSGKFILGPEVEAFESEIAKYIGTKYAISCANGTDALILSLLVAQQQTYARTVVTVANSAPATVAAIIKAGCVPVFADILPNGLMDHSKLSQWKTYGECLAILPVDLYGQIHKVKYEHFFDNWHFEDGPVLIEDAAQAMGSKLLNTTSAWAKCVSFYPTKNLGALGDGGMILTDSEQLNTYARKLRFYGLTNGKINYKDGFNSRLDELQAAILRVRLKYLDRNNDRRRELAKLYTILLPIPLLHRQYREDENYHLFTIRTPHRDALKAFLEEQNIETMIHYPHPAYKYGILRKEGELTNYQGLEETERFSREILSLPMWPGLTTSEVSRVCETISGFFNHL